MIDLSDVKVRLRRGNALLFRADSPCLAHLLVRLGGMNRRAAVLWALGCVRAPVLSLREFFPGDARFEEALLFAGAWAQGKVKMPAARRAILAAHAAAKETGSVCAAALCHAVGQGCSAVHSVRHAPGLAYYELTSLVLRFGLEGCEEAVNAKIVAYERFAELAARDADIGPWANFLRE